MTGYCTLYIAASSDDEAAAIARALIAERLVACANLVSGVRSLYRWEGEIHDNCEVLILCKTRSSLADQAIVRVRTLHSYDCPCVVALPIEAGNPDYLNWIKAETEDSSED